MPVDGFSDPRLELLRQMDEELAGLERRVVEATEPPSLEDLIQAVCNEASNPEPWVPTGLGPLDHLLDGGVRPSEVCVVAARPGVGKSAFALQVILHAAREGIGVALWSLEMSPKAWVRRALCTLSGVPSRTLRRGETMTQDEATRFTRAVVHLRKLNEHIRFVEGASDPDSFYTQAGVETELHGCRLLVVDYLQLMQPPEGKASRENEVAETSRRVKRTALRFNVAVLLLAQVNRKADDRPPQLSDLRESGAVEQDADEVFFLHRERDPESHVLTDLGLGVLAKNRDGEMGSFPLRYEGARYRFLPVEQEERFNPLPQYPRPAA